MKSYPKIHNTKLQGRIPFKFDKKNVSISIGVFFIIIFIFIYLSRHADFFAIPFILLFEYLSDSGFDLGLSIIGISLSVYGFLTITTLISKRQTWRQFAMRTLLKDEQQKLFDWGTIHKLYKSTYDVILTRLYVRNKANGSINKMFALILIQLPVTLGLMYSLKHSDVFDGVTFLGVSLSHSNLYMGFFIMFLYAISIGSRAFDKNPNVRRAALIQTLLIALSMGAIVYKTSFGVGLYFAIGQFVIIIRQIIFHFIDTPMQRFYERHMEVLYTFDDIIANDVDIDINVDNLALDYDTKAPGKL